MLQILIQKRVFKIFVLFFIVLFGFNIPGFAQNELQFSLESLTPESPAETSQDSSLDSFISGTPLENSQIFLKNSFTLTPSDQRGTVNETSLSGGTYSYTPGLKASSVTTFSGSPRPYLMTGSSSQTTLALASNGTFQLGYNVVSSNTFSGMTISFDDASTPAIETQNLSLLKNVTFGLKGPAAAMKLEFVDSSGQKTVFTLINLSNNSERFWQIPVSAILSPVDKTKIKQINLYVDASTTTSQTRTGTISIRTLGLNTNPPAIPVVTSQIPAATPNTTLTLSGTKEANTAIFINGVQVVPANSSTTWSSTVSLSVEGTNTLNVQAKNSIGKLSGSSIVSTIRDTTAPVIIPLGLPSNPQTTLPYFVIPYQIQDANPVNPQESLAVDLVPGLNTITLTTYDLAGNLGQQTLSIEYLPVDSNLTVEEKNLRTQWLQENFLYFTEAQGINSSTGLPVDILGPNAPPNVFWTQPTSIGFYLHLLGNVISKRLLISSFSQAAALAAAEKTLTTLLDVQTRFGWNGLIPWLRLDGTLRPDSPKIGLIDNVNLTVHLAAFLGLLEEGNLQFGLASSLYDKAKDFIDAQQAGYQNFVDPAAGVFRLEYDTAGHTFYSYADRFGNEIRSAIPFLIEYYGLPSSVWTNLIRTTSAYPTLQGRRVETFSAFDGSAFQYFWPLLVSPEESLPQIGSGLQNAFLIFNDFMERKNLAGFPSAASLPEGGYSGKIGIDFLKEDSIIMDETIASVYALASAYRLNPAWVLSKISEIEQLFPALSGPLGFYDALRTTTGAVSQNYYAIDQGSLLLGLLGTGADDFRAFFEKRNLWAAYESFYANLTLNISQAASSLPEPPMTPSELSLRNPDSADLYSLGYDFDGIMGNGIAATESSPGVFTYTRTTTSSGWIGGFVTPTFDRNHYDYVVIEARSLAPGDHQIRFELKNNGDFILQKNLQFQGTGWQVFQFFFPKNTAPINFVAFADASGNFEVRRLYFTDTPLFQTSVNSDNLYLAGYDYNGMMGNGLAVTESSPGVFTYTRTTTSSGWIGGFVTPAFNGASYDYVVIQARSLSSETNQVRLELKNNGDFILQQTLDFQGTDWQTFHFSFPAGALPINFIAFADAVGDFEVRSLYFTDVLPAETGLPSGGSPEIVQTSPTTTTQTSYNLTYTVNGFPRSEGVHLTPGLNTIRRSFQNAFGETVAYDFSVILLA